MVVFRWRTRVVGRAFLNVQNGRVDAADVLSASRNLGADALRPWLEETLGYDERDLLGTPSYRATVAICTRERADSLDGLLRAVGSLTRDGHEVLVIDNAPKTDQTRQVVERHAGVRYVCEMAPGLNVARNRAIREARGDIVAFCDDDAIPERGWLDNLMRNFGDMRVQCVTGLTLPIELETEAQELFETVSSFAHGFRRRIFDGQHDNPVAVGEVGVGANMAIRRRVIAEVGLFDERLDGGMPTRSGGDQEMFVRLLSAGHRIVYDPAAVSWHRHRRTHRELVDTLYGYGVACTRCSQDCFSSGASWACSRWPGCGSATHISRSCAGCCSKGLQRPRANSARRVSRVSSRTSRVACRQAATADGRTTLMSGVAVTIVVPTHNRVTALMRLLRSLEHQMPLEGGFEVVVVDDGSADGTAAAVSAINWSFPLIVHEQVPSGPAAARNAGAARAAGDILLFLDDDMEPMPEVVRAHAMLHSEYPNSVGIGDLQPAVTAGGYFGTIIVRGWWHTMNEGRAARSSIPLSRPAQRSLLHTAPSVPGTRGLQLGPALS